MKYFKLSRFFGTAFGVLFLLNTSSVLGMEFDNNEESGKNLVLRALEVSNNQEFNTALDMALNTNVSKMFEENQKKIARIRGVEPIAKCLKDNEKKIKIVVPPGYSYVDGYICKYREQHIKYAGKNTSEEGTNTKYWRYDSRCLKAKHVFQILAEALYDNGLDAEQVKQELENNNLSFEILENGGYKFKFGN